MINYEIRKWGLLSLLQIHGSVFPRALAAALPAAGLAMLVHWIVHEQNLIVVEANDITAGVIGGYTGILGLVIGTRASNAYSRWWEGGTLLQQLRGEWFNAYSSLLAFTSLKPEMKEDVEKFQQVLVRLMSLLYCSALQQVSTDPHVAPELFELIDTFGMDQEQLDFLDTVNDKVEVVLQWIQRLIVTNIGNGVLPIAPPIISRVFQEYSRGIVNLNNARKIADFPFPFPLVQMLSLMMSIHWLVIPLTCGTIISNIFWAGLLTFLVVFSFWCIHFFSFELEMPFGSSTNHLPLVDMQSDMNKSLLTLLRRKAQFPPDFNCPQNPGAPNLKTGLMKKKDKDLIRRSAMNKKSMFARPASKDKDEMKVIATDSPPLEVKSSGVWEPIGGASPGLDPRVSPGQDPPQSGKDLPSVPLSGGTSDGGQPKSGDSGQKGPEGTVTITVAGDQPPAPGKVADSGQGALSPAPGNSSEPVGSPPKLPGATGAAG
mmetsp:Transcript_9308/g.16457  ORF Transcript_9308/g.16457 Transcript_9308/m.16457 type:complete len:487 (+) Transcript_9308:68-1528(+)